MKLLLTVLSIIVVCTITWPIKPVMAASEFSTSFHSTYAVSTEGTSQVEHQIDIKNNLAHIYMTEYTISLGASTLSDLEVLVDGQDTSFRKETVGTATTLTITITSPVVGKDQVLPLTIRYKTDGLVERYGKVWEVNIPKLSKANEASVYTRKILFPSNLGTPKVESPQPTARSTNENGEIVLEYIGFPSASITLLFGEHEDYKLNLVYQITNPTLGIAVTEIALPPDTEYQQVYLDKLDPPPSLIKTDSDGNWLAVYELKSQESKEVRADMFVSVYPIPTFPSFVSDLDSLKETAPFWEIKSSSIKSLSANLKNPENIYTYLVENMTYDYEKIRTAERIGAEKALSDPNSAICTEFTDSFVALARAAKIPAREVNGYAKTANMSLRPAGFTEDILHAWPEYYDIERKTWVQVDPTWGRTTGGINYFDKLDYGHITFVRHGKEPEYPYPAGSYKSDPKNKTINVDITKEIPTASKTYSEKEKDSIITLTNTGNVALRNYKAALSDGSEYTIDYLPPYGKVKISSNSINKRNVFEKLLQLLKKLCGTLDLCVVY